MNVFRFECDIAEASAKFVRLLLMTVAFVFDLSMKSYAYDSEDELIVDEYEYFVAEDVGYEEEESVEMPKDPREIGTGGLEGLQWRPNSTEKKYSYDYTLENTPSLKEFLETPSGSPEMKKRVSEGYAAGSMDTEGIYAPDLYDSKYDHEVKSINELENLEDFRAEKQPGLLKMFNGMVKGTYYVYSLFCYTLVIQTDDFQLKDKLEKQIPNYMTSEERLENEKEEWSEMIDNANFWGCVLGGYQQRVIKSFGEFLFFFFANVVVSVVVGAFGARKEVGFKWAFLLSCAFSPFVGFVITLFSKKKNVIEFNEPSIKEV